MKYTAIIPAIVLLMSVSACGNNKSGSANDVQPIDVSAYTGGNALSAIAAIDSLAMEADFLSPEQGVTVLVGLSEIVKRREGNSRLEYMRKFVDTYDILINRGDEFSRAILSAKASTSIDLPALFDQYRDVLNEEADGSAIEGEESPVTDAPAVSAKPDTSAARSAKPAPAPADSVG